MSWSVLRCSSATPSCELAWRESSHPASRQLLHVDLIGLAAVSPRCFVPTANGYKILIMFKVLGATSQIQPVNLAQGEQNQAHLLVLRLIEIIRQSIR
jgi:hypothetical protein